MKHLGNRVGDTSGPGGIIRALRTILYQEPMRENVSQVLL